MTPRTLETGESNPAQESQIETSEDKRDRSLRTVIGAVSLALGTVLLVPLSLSSGIPSTVGSLAAILLTGGTLLVGTSIRGRSV
jgi:uncharacterized membrane protein YccC